MNSKKKVLISIILYIYIAISFLSFLSVKTFDFYSEICTVFSLLTFISIIALNIKEILKYNKTDLFFLFIILFFQTVIGIVNKTGVGSMISNITIIMGIIAISSFEFSNQVYKILLVLACIVAISMLSISSNSYAIFLKNREEHFNPNIIGQVIVYMVVYINLCTKKLKINQVFSIIISIICMYGVYLTESRTALISIIVYLMLEYPLNFIWRKKHFRNLIIVSIFIIITIMPFIMNYIYSNKIISANSKYGTKVLYTGREKIWNESISILNQEHMGWIYGAGSKTNLKSFSYINMHNMVFSIIFNFGIIITTIMLCFFISKFIRKDTSQETNWYSLAFLVFLIMGIFETSIYWPNIYCFAILILGQYNNRIIK